MLASGPTGAAQSALAFVAAVPGGRDAAAVVLLLLAAAGWVKLWGALTNSGVVDSKTSRKLIHVGSGPGFVLGWALFSDAPSALYAACIVPSLQLIRLWRAGKSAAAGGSSELVAAISRSGVRSEVLQGPFLYTCVLLAAVVLSWRQMPGIIGVVQMGVGDGLADLVGRRIGGRKWWFSETKSYAGTAAFAIGGFVASLLMVAVYGACGITLLTVQQAALPLLAISIASSLVELVPYGDDNLTVPVVAAVLTALLLPGF